MQEGTPLQSRQVNRELLVSILNSPKWFWAAMAILGFIVLAAMSAAGFMINQGFGVTGLNRPVMWGFFITNFVFWIGISHAGVMLSAILRLSKAEWRRPRDPGSGDTDRLLINDGHDDAADSHRPAVAHALLDLYVTLRPLRLCARHLAERPVAVVWDPSAVYTYLTSSILFVMVALIPDFAVLRDRTTGLSNRIYGMLAMGWQGNPRQWKLQIIAGVLLSALILPVFVSVHSIVSWDFGMAVSVKSWHSTIFAPYFVVGAVHSGVSAVAFVLIILRFAYGWQNYIRHEHIDALARLLVVVATGWFYFFVMEVIFGFYGREADEIAVRNFQFMISPWNIWMFIFVGLTYFLPVSIWLSRSARRNLWIMSIACISVNIGMWLERFLIIVPGLARKQLLTFDWYTYRPSTVEWMIIGGTFALVSMLMLMIARVVPLIPLYDVKEGEILRTEIRIGRVTVPATFRED